MAKMSAGILLYRINANEVTVLLVHPGGPFWSKKDLGAWSIPKGEYVAGENPEAAALREFREELGVEIVGELTALGEIIQSGGKHVTVFALEGELDVASTQSSSFLLEWPPKSGQMQEFPEIDSAAWFSLSQAGEKLLPSQRPFLDRLVASIQNRDGKGARQHDDKA